MEIWSPDRNRGHQQPPMIAAIALFSVTLAAGVAAIE
jgi:hypothetical protein